jgi:hypothetical protein
MSGLSEEYSLAWKKSIVKENGAEFKFSQYRKMAVFCEKIHFSI